MLDQKHNIFTYAFLTNNPSGSLILILFTFRIRFYFTEYIRLQKSFCIGEHIEEAELF
jgi:hypothetical protein